MITDADIQALRDQYALEKRIVAGELSLSEGLRALMKQGLTRREARAAIFEAFGGGDCITTDAAGRQVYHGSGVGVADLDQRLANL